MSDTLSKADRRGSFHIKRRSLSTEQISRRTFHRQSEAFVTRISQLDKRRSRQLMLRQPILVPGCYSNLMNKSEPSESAQLKKAQRHYRSSSSVLENERTMLPRNVQLKLNFDGDVQRLKGQPAASKHQPSNEQAFLRKRSHQIDKLHRTLRATKPVNATLGEFNRRRKQSEADGFPSAVEIREVKTIGGQLFIVSLRLDQEGLFVRADLKNYLFGEPKVIRLSRQNSIYFLKKYCDNQLSRIYERLHYDGMYLYLLADKPPGPAGNQ